MPETSLQLNSCRHSDSRLHLRQLQESGQVYLYRDDTYLHWWLGKALQVCSWAAVMSMGVNAGVRRELVGLKVGDSESETLWAEFIASLKEHGLSGVKLVVSDVHVGLSKAIRQESAAEICNRWDELATCLAERFPKAAELLNEAREDVVAFKAFPKPHFRKNWSTNLLEWVNEGIKRRSLVVAIIPNDSAITLLVGAVLLEQDEHWLLEGRRMFSAEGTADPSL